jgi:D-methionine transport system ATP-binding protein
MLRLHNIHKTFATAKGSLKVVKNVSLQIYQGDVYGIVGTSGAGKSTLLRTINLLERPDSGEVILDGVDLTKLSRKQLLRQRLQIGMIFQHFHLIGNSTVYDNISFPLEIAGLPKAERKERIAESLSIVGLTDKANVYPAKLSGGQKQRVAIARSLVTRPRLLLCDEPTSALDPATTHQILRFLREINEKLRITIIIVTHEMGVVQSICNKVSVMEQGSIAETIRLADRSYVPRTQIARFLMRSGEGLQEGEQPLYVHSHD